MIKDDQITRSILLSAINFWIGTSFLLVVALGAGLIIWHTATGLNPITDAMVAELQMGGGSQE